MRLVSFRHSGVDGLRLGILEGEHVVDVAQAFGGPGDMLSLLQHETQSLAWLQERWAEGQSDVPSEVIYPLSAVKLAAPLPNPTSVRDFYAFEEHVKTARGRRGLAMIPEWYEIPVFYFSNHQAILGPEDIIPYPKRTKWLDFELEVAAVIGRQGRDISVDEADTYIAGYTIMNDWSARDVQRQEMKVGLGPAKGKDFATSIGPWLITPDELTAYRAEKGFDLTMVARRNGVEVSRGNWRSISYSFAQMIARASEDVPLYPGDLIGSGTVGTGCILELGPETVGGWLQPGDVIELEVEQLGVLRNVIGE